MNRIKKYFIRAVYSSLNETRKALRRYANVKAPFVEKSMPDLAGYRYFRLQFLPDLARESLGSDCSSVRRFYHEGGRSQALERLAYLRKENEEYKWGMEL